MKAIEYIGRSSRWAADGAAAVTKKLVMDLWLSGSFGREIIDFLKAYYILW